MNIIRARAVFHIAANGEKIGEVKVGGYPCRLQRLPNGNLLGAGWDDSLPGSVREDSPDGSMIWSVESLKWPWKAQRLANGNTLIADAGTNRVFEVTPELHEVWRVNDLGPKTPELFDALGPVYVDPQVDGNTLVSIRGLNRLVELDSVGHLLWEVDSTVVQAQYPAVRLWNGNVLIADGRNFRVIEIDIDKRVVWRRGLTVCGGAVYGGEARCASTLRDVMRSATAQARAESPTLAWASSRRIQFLPRCPPRWVIGVYQQDSPSMLPPAHTVSPPPPNVPLDTAQSYQRPVMSGSRSITKRRSRLNDAAVRSCTLLGGTACGQPPLQGHLAFR